MTSPIENTRRSTVCRWGSASDKHKDLTMFYNMIYVWNQLASSFEPGFQYPRWFSWVMLSLLPFATNLSKSPKLDDGLGPWWTWCGLSSLQNSKLQTSRHCDDQLVSDSCALLARTFEKKMQNVKRLSCAMLCLLDCPGFLQSMIPGLKKKQKKQESWTVLLPRRIALPCSMIVLQISTSLCLSVISCGTEVSNVVDCGSLSSLSTALLEYSRKSRV